MRIAFDPIAFAAEVAEQAHPDLDFEFEFAYLADADQPDGAYSGPWGAAEFPEDGVLRVVVDPRLPIQRFAEIFLHEVAHLVVGAETGHGEAWATAFNRLHSDYHRLFAERYGEPTAMV